MWIYIHTKELYHHGILGQKWGVRRYQNKDGSLTKEGKLRYYKESDKTIIVNKDGSRTIPKGFIFNRVGQQTLDPNESGGLYVSYGRADASRYVKSLGPTKIGKLLNNYGTNVQHITVKSNLRMPNDDQTTSEIIKVLKKNESLLNSFNKSIYSLAIGYDDIKKSDLNDEKSDFSKKVAYGVNSFFGDPNYKNETKIIYEHFRKIGYDCVPDLHDKMTGTAENPIIVINTDKVQMTSSTYISKDIMKEAKAYVKKAGRLKVSEVIK